jgi:hypothetical protein
MSVGIEAGRQRFGASRFLPRSTLHRPSWPNKKTNLNLCLEKSRRGCDQSVRPDIRIVLSVEESGVDPQAKSRMLDTPLDRVAHA